MISTVIDQSLGLEFPIFQGGMAWVADASLAAGVSNAGGLGIIAAMNSNGEQLREEIRKCKTMTDKISDEIFSKIVAVIRIAVPYTGMIISTRESQESRKKVLELGISQISGGSRTSVGGYAETELPDHNSAQFDVSDTRTLDEVVNWLLELGYIPSFCTACYREGRTGDRFMSLVKSGQIANCCGPNALMTLKEYLEDYASEDTRQKGLELILKETDRIPNPKIREIAIRNLKAIAAGQRDFRF